MNKLLSAAAALLFITNIASAQAPAEKPSSTSVATPSGVDSPECEAKAIGKNGKPLTGVAKSSFMKKCASENRGGGAADSCEKKALSKDGKPLAGAAKASFLKKCQADTAKQ